MNYFTDNTEVVFATKKNDSTAIFGNKDKIFYKTYNVVDIIGEAIAKYKNIKTVNYFLLSLSSFSKIGKYKDLENDSSIFLGSYDFCRDDLCYLYYSDLIDDSNGFDLEKILLNCPSKKKRDELLDEILEMFALDTYMMQQDRLQGNIMFELNENYEIHLAPLFDYEDSLKLGYSAYANQDYNLYPNPLHFIKNIDDYKIFINKYPSFLEKLAGYQELDLCNIIKSDFDSRNFDISKFYCLDYFRKFQNISCHNIQKILK